MYSKTFIFFIILVTTWKNAHSTIDCNKQTFICNSTTTFFDCIDDGNNNTFTDPTDSSFTLNNCASGTICDNNQIFPCASFTLLPTTVKVTTIKPTVKPTNNTTIKPTVKPPNNTTIKPTVKPPNNTTIKPTVKPPNNTTIKPTVKPPNNTTIKPTVKPPNNTTIKPTVKPPNNTTIKPTVKPPNNTTIKPTVKPPNNTTIKPTVKPPNNTTIKPTVKPPNNTTIKPTVKPPNNTTIKPTVKPPNNTTIKPTVKPPNNTTIKPTVKPPNNTTIKPTVKPPNNTTINPVVIGWNFNCTITGRFLSTRRVDCKEYVICTSNSFGIISPAYYNCPSSTIFSASLLRCVLATLTTCIPITTTTPRVTLHPPVCKGNGRCSNPFVADCKGYIVSTTDSKGNRIEAYYLCPATSIFNPLTFKCTIPPFYICPSKVTVKPTTRRVTIKPTTTTKRPTRCTAVGKISDPSVANCKGYIMCSRDVSGNFVEAKYNCPLTSVFDPVIKICSILYKCTPPCTKVGRFADPSVTGCKGYTLCSQILLVFIQTKYTCASITVFSPKTNLCTLPSVYPCPN